MNIYGRRYPHDPAHVRVKVTKTTIVPMCGLLMRGAFYLVPPEMADHLIRRLKVAVQGKVA